MSDAVNLPARRWVRVERRERIAQDIVALDLVDGEGGELPAFEAGAHIELFLPGGMIRPYSLYGDPQDRDRYRIAVLREPASRGGSRAVHELLLPWTRLQIGPPKARFPLDAQAPKVLLLAGGIGLTPLLSMAAVLARDARPYALHLACRSAARVPFGAGLRDLPGAGDAVVHLDDGEPAQRLDLPALLAAQPPDTALQVCGPAGLIDAALAEARRQGWAESRLHWERFAADPALEGGDGGPVEEDEAFEVELAHSGRVISVRADQTVVEALGAEGIEILTSCGEGVCGTCLTRVIAGEPDHRDQYLTPEEQAACDQFLPCCSRAKSSRLVLDL